MRTSPAVPVWRELLQRLGAVDSGALLALRDEVEAAVEGLIQKLQHLRARDHDRGTLRRLPTKW